MSFSLWAMDCRGHPRELDRVVTSQCRACSGRSWPKTGRFPRSGAGIHPQILLTRREECLWLSHQGAVQDGYLLPPGWIRPRSHPMKNHQIMPVEAKKQQLKTPPKESTHFVKVAYKSFMTEDSCVIPTISSRFSKRVGFLAESKLSSDPAKVGRRRGKRPGRRPAG